MLLQKVKTALRISSDAFDAEISDLLEAGLLDLAIVGADIYVTRDTETGAIASCDPLIQRALTTYVRLNFGAPEDYDRLKRSYDEQKAQIRCNPNYMRAGC